MPRGYTYIPLTVATLCYAITDYSVATLSNSVIPWLVGSLATVTLISAVGLARLTGWGRSLECNGFALARSTVWGRGLEYDREVQLVPPH